MRLTCCHIAAGFALLVGGSNAEMQTWTSADGRAIEGEFVRLFGNAVTIKRANGTTVNCQLSSLNEASRQQAKQSAEAAKAATVKKAAVPVFGAKPNGLALSPLKASGVPTEEEIKAFVTEYKETPNSDESYEFTARFSVPSLLPADLRSFAKKKKIPYRVTVELNKTKTVDGKKRTLRVDGQAFLVLMNEAGEVVDRQREALGKLCPS
jgi:hypothetical protein